MIYNLRIRLVDLGELHSVHTQAATVYYSDYSLYTDSIVTIGRLQIFFFPYQKLCIYKVNQLNADMK